MDTFRLSDIRELNHVACQGGELRELFCSDDYGQVTLRLLRAGEGTAPHRHPCTDERWMLLSGWADLELAGVQFILGPFVPVQVQAGRRHSLRARDGDALLLFWSSRVYDRERPDKED